MKKNLLALILFFIAEFSFAQSSRYCDFSVGPVVAEKLKITEDEIVGADEDGVYVFGSSTSGGNVITKYNQKLEFEKREKVEVKVGSKAVEILNFPFPIFFGGHLLVCGMMYGSQKETVMTAYELDKNTLLRKGDTMKMVKSQRSSFGAFIASEFVVVGHEEFSKLSGFAYDISAGENKLLVYGIPGQTKEANQEFTVAVYNTDLTMDWQKKFILPYSNDLFSIENVLVDDLGNIYITAILFNEKVEGKVKGKPNYQYVLLALRRDKTKPVEFRVSSTQHFIMSMGVGIFHDGRVMGAGFYSDQFDVLSVKGTVTFSFDLNTGKVKEKSFKPFSQEILANFMSEKKAAKGKEVKDFLYRDVYFGDDGSARVLAERVYFSQGKLHNDEIVVIALNPDLIIDWTTVIPKKQKAEPAASSTEQGLGVFLSFVSCINNDRLLIFFNDNEKNAGQAKGDDDDNEEEFNRIHSIPFMVAVENNGDWKKMSLSDNKDVRQLIMPGLAYQGSNDELYLYLEEAQGRLDWSKRDSRLARIRLKT